MIHSWTAHDSALVSVEHVEHEQGEFLLTASTDKTCKLWSMEGRCVGIFGQVPLPLIVLQLLLRHLLNIDNILQYKTQYIRYIGLPVTNVALNICVPLLSILSLYKHLYISKCLPVCCRGEINLLNWPV